MGPTTPKEHFESSLARCADDDRFMPLFYFRFLASSEEVRSKFRQTDFDQLGMMLLQSLRLAAGAAAGDPESLKEIQERAQSHSRRHMNIEPHLYEIWLETLIQAARECDPEWNEAVENGWRIILGHVIRTMIRHY